MKRKKILQTLYSGLNGVGAVAFSMIEADKEKKIDWVLIFYGIEDLLEEYRLKCEALNIPYFLLKKEKGELALANQYKLYQFIKKEKPDAIFCYMSSLIFICKLHKMRNANCQLISSEHHAIALRGRKYWWLSRQVLRLSDKVVYLTPSYQKEMAERIPGKWNEEKVHVIPNGIDIERYSPKKTEQKEIGEERMICLGMMCRLTATKDIPTIFNALNELRGKPYFNRLRFLLAGDGEKRKEWEALTKSLNITEQVEFLGMLKEAELFDFMKELDIYIQSTFGETMSISVMQAQAMALPIVASSVNGVKEFIVDGETGFLFELENAKALAEKIDDLINDDALCSKLGIKARSFAVENYSNTTMLERYLALT